MPTTPTRGSWELDQAISQRWADANLDDTFRAEWTDPTATTYHPLHDAEARPATPTPYCIYSRTVPAAAINHSTGLDKDTQKQYWSTTLQFKIHARSTSSESGKSIAKRMAVAVAAAFDPPARLSMTNDKHISTIRGPDFPVREGDEEWAWVLTYTLRLEGTYDAATAP